ncbi:Protein kinase [uncultured virus]|nr:Protein kinase [uncultured virus]
MATNYQLQRMNTPAGGVPVSNLPKNLPVAPVNIALPYLPKTPVISTDEIIPAYALESQRNQIDPSKANKYHDYECCEWTRGIDTLLFRYLQDRAEVTSMMLNNPDELIKTIWKQDGPLAIDNSCRCKMGYGERRTPFACAQCKNLRRLMDFRIGGVEKPFQLECGESAGKNLIIASSSIASPFLMWDDDAARRAKVYVQQYHNVTLCGTPNIQNLRCITGDSFTIRTLILWMIHRRFAEKGLPHCPLLHTAFICNSNGYSLYTMPSIGPMPELHKNLDYHNLDLTTTNTTVKSQHFAYTPLKYEIVRTIIVQLLVILLELSEINFSHGTPSVHGLVFNKDPVSYAYDGVQIIGPITVQITDLWNSSATFNKIHYFPKNIRSSTSIERNMFAPTISTKTVSMAYCGDIGAIQNLSQDPIACPVTLQTCPDAITYEVCKPQNINFYQLTSSTLDIYAAIRHIGFPIFASSFDLYCFMISLMCDKSFYATVINDQRLYRLWSMMWLSEDLFDVESLIREAQDVETNNQKSANNRTSSNTVINIIRGKWLRCDITQFLWSLIKLGW